MVSSAWQHLGSKVAGVDWRVSEQQMLLLPEESLQKKRRWS